MKKMAWFAEEILYPDGRLPSIADCPGGRPSVVNWPWQELPDWESLTDLRRTLSAGTTIRGQPGAKLWPDSGYFVLRTGAPNWTPAEAMMLTFRTGPVSRAHQHHDQLSITLFANGRALLSGPGYPPMLDSTERSRLISTTSQNTVSVDNQAQVLGPSKVIWQRLNDGVTAISAVSNLYEGVTHRRSIVYGPQADAILIVDELMSDRPRDFRQHFRFAPGLSVSAGSAAAECSENGRRLLRVKTQAVADGREVPVAATARGEVATFHVRASEMTFVTLLSPGLDAQQPEITRTNINWRGPRGEVDLQLPLDREQAMRWLPLSVPIASQPTNE